MKNKIAIVLSVLSLMFASNVMATAENKRLYFTGNDCTYEVVNGCLPWIVITSEALK